MCIRDWILGHSHPEIITSLQKQVELGTAFSAPIEKLIDYSELLCKRIPSIDTLRFTNSGTEATLLAIRAARAYTKKSKIAKFEGGYHGTHESVVISVTPQLENLSETEYNPVQGYESQPTNILEDVVLLPYNNLDVCETILRSHKDNLSCVIIEPIVSAFGYTPLNLSFLEGIRQITQDLDILLIFDEVQSLRISSGGAQEYFSCLLYTSDAADE